MKYRKLGRTALTVSEIGFGSWGIGGGLWTGSSDENALAALARALQLGVSFFDTAYVYGDGRSEQLIARAFREAGRRGYVATKVPPKSGRWPGAGAVEKSFPGDWIVRCTERSLKNLELEQVELQQLHVWSDDWLSQPGWDDALAAIERLKREGKIRFWGVSINSREPGSAVKLVRTGLVDTVQVIFNVFEQEPLEALFPACREQEVGVIVRVPLDEGGLTGKLTEDTRFPKGDFRDGYFAGRLLGETVRRAKALEKVLVNGDTPDLAHAALRFCLSFPEVATVIPGMRTPAHVDANAAVSDRPPYPAELLTRLKAHAWKRDLAAA